MLTRHPATPAEWLQSVRELAAATERIPLAERRRSHEGWWREFWNRSWIHATTAVPASGMPAGKPKQDDAAYLSQMLYYKTNAQGQLVFHPSQALETWWECTNAMPEVAGLHAVTAKLLILPEDKATAAQRAYWKAFAARLPPLPTHNTPSGEALAPAASFASKNNQENPELYAVFPFRLCSFEKDNRDLGLRALRHRLKRGHSGWQQDDIFMAYLGQADDTAKAVVSRARMHDPGSRFPAFWGPNYDWIPDQTHGGVLLKAVQSMLLQTDGRKIYLLPAWPKGWDCDFKLHAPFQTVVAGTVANGKLAEIRVTPEMRRNDVQIMEAQ